MKQNKLGPLLILLAGCFWGSMGLFVRTLQGYGFGPMHITSVRLVLAGLFFALLLLLKDPRGFRLRVRDIPLFLGLGLASILFFTATSLPSPCCPSPRRPFSSTPRPSGSRCSRRWCSGRG